MSAVTRYDQMEASAHKFHGKHPNVWTMFVMFTNDRIERGFTHYGVAAVFERIRWEARPGADGKLDFKLNNNHKAFYVRWFAEAYPEHAAFYRTREQISKNRPASKYPEITPADLVYTNQSNQL